MENSSSWLLLAPCTLLSGVPVALCPSVRGVFGPFWKVSSSLIVSLFPQQDGRIDGTQSILFCSVLPKLPVATNKAPSLRFFAVAATSTLGLQHQLLFSNRLCSVSPKLLDEAILLRFFAVAATSTLFILLCF